MARIVYHRGHFSVKFLLHDLAKLSNGIHWKSLYACSFDEQFVSYNDAYWPDKIKHKNLSYFSCGD